MPIRPLDLTPEGRDTVAGHSWGISARAPRRAVMTACLGIALVVAPTLGAAEWFADLYLGAAFTQRHEVTTETPTGTTSHPDIGFNRSAAFGGRAGYWFDI